MVYMLLSSFIFHGWTQSDTEKCQSGEWQQIYSEDFTGDLSNWRVEFEKPDSSGINCVDGKLELITSRGATVWYKHKLQGNVMIVYEVVIVQNGGAYDRVSDMNAFWMASDPLTNGEIVRPGNFLSYDNLKLYYAGVGGHNNTFTRFRKYHGDGNKPVLKEYTDQNYLLKPNTVYEVKIVVKNKHICYYVNDVLYWEFLDEAPYTSGYFGFRTTMSHQLFDNFKVYCLSQPPCKSSVK